MTKEFTLFLCLSASACQLEQLFPCEIWTKIVEYLPGNHLFLHQLLYLKKPETGVARISLTKKIAKNIQEALEKKIEKVLFKKLSPWWIDDSFLTFSEMKRSLTYDEVYHHISAYINTLANMYATAPQENKTILHEMLWKRVLEQSHERTMDEYPGLECRKPINYSKVTTATIMLSATRTNSWTAKYKRYTIHKLDTIGKCAIALLIISDNKQLINKQQYGEQLAQLLPELQLNH